MAGHSLPFNFVQRQNISIFMAHASALILIMMAISEG